MIVEHMHKLEQFRYLKVPMMANDFFRLSLQSMAENWRRFVLPTQGFPFCLFSLLNSDDDLAFLELSSKFCAKQKACPKCADVEFSTLVLKYLDVEDPLACSRVPSLRAFLEDVCVFCPLSSDLVECVHGWSQHVLHRWRGVKPTEAVAQERVLWALITRAYERLRSWIYDRYGDAHSGHRLHKFGTLSSNQYSQKSSSAARKLLCMDEDGCVHEAETTRTPKKQADKSKSLSFEKLDRLLASDGSLPMPRKVCGA